MSTSTAIDNIGANMDNGQILYLLPSVEVGGMTVSPQFEWAPTANDAAQYDGTASSTASELDSGMGVALVASGNGLTLELGHYLMLLKQHPYHYLIQKQ